MSADTQVRLWVMAEKGRILATKKFVLGTDPIRSVVILGREMNEVRGAVDAKDNANLVEELVQVATVAELWLEYLYTKGMEVAGNDSDKQIQATDNYSTGGTVGERREGDGRRRSGSGT